MEGRENDHLSWSLPDEREGSRASRQGLFHSEKQVVKREPVRLILRSEQALFLLLACLFQAIKEAQIYCLLAKTSEQVRYS
jgi:hypothetical protein